MKKGSLDDFIFKTFWGEAFWGSLISGVNWNGDEEPFIHASVQPIAPESPQLHDVCAAVLRVQRPVCF